MYNKIPLFSLIFFFVLAVRTEWSMPTKLCVILNSLLVLVNVVKQLKELKSNVRK